ncbi:hypothetical protein [Streptomyces avermitilis]|uniref:hypothetical protein n=1 Tax=Streptomyces avermitilis TaxID=33903 RepID=UPI00381A3D3B
MSDDQPLDPGEIPEFTGDLEQLEKDVSAIGTDATSLWDAGTQIDTTFRSLSAYYEAPDADRLFATTAPVAAAGNDLCDELETIASALGAYADEVRPLKNKFERLKEEAAAFRTAVADDDGSDTVTSKARLRILEKAAQVRHFAVRWDNLIMDWKAQAGRAHEIHGTIDSAAEWGEAKGSYKESHTVMGSEAEKFGEAVAEHHYIAENYPDFDKQTLLGPKNGNDQFDQVWLHEDGRVVVVEAKSSPGTDLGRRTLSGGKQVSQGSREYFYDILEAMEKRGEYDLVESMEKALDEGKLDYVVVKGEKNSGTYTGYQYRRFDISKGTLP